MRGEWEVIRSGYGGDKVRAWGDENGGIGGIKRGSGVENVGKVGG